MIHTIKLRVMAGGLEAGDVVRREAARESEAGDVSRREAIRGLKASLCAGRRRGEGRQEIAG